MGTVAAALGKPLMPWQAQVMDTGLELDEEGGWAYQIVVVTVPRQAGKTTSAAALSLHRMLSGPDKACKYTAQNRQKAREYWQEQVKLFKRSPLGTSRELMKIRLSNGDERVTLFNDSTYAVFVPNEDNIHGSTNELVLVDEAWIHRALAGEALMQAVMPTFTTTGGQLWIISTAGTGASEWLRSFVDKGRAAVESDSRSTLAYFEWGIADDVDPTDLDAVLAAHPGNGYTLNLAALKAASESMSPGEFARAYGNRWTAAAESAIPAAIWEPVQRETEPLPEPGTCGLVLAVDVGMNAQDAAIAAAWSTPDGRRHAAIIDARPGTSWLRPRLKELEEKWRPVSPPWIDAYGPARVFADEAAREGLYLTAITSADYATACAALLSELQEGAGGLTITRDSDLDAAVAGAAKRPLGEAWAWGRRASTSTIAPLVAITLAIWAYDHNPARFEIL